MTAVHSIHGPGQKKFSMTAFVDSLQALCHTYPQLRLEVNFYDEKEPALPLSSIVRHDPRISTSWTRGMRTLHWSE